MSVAQEPANLFKTINFYLTRKSLCVGTMTAELQSKAHVYSLEYFVSNVCFSFLCVLVFLLSGLLRVVKK